MHEIYSKNVPHASFKTVKCVEGYDCIRSEYSAYLSDESKLTGAPFDFLFFPKDEPELAAVIREMNQRNLSLTIASARTGLVGGCVPTGDALVSLEHLDQVESIYFDSSNREWRICAQTSLSLRNLDAMLRTKQFPGLDQNAHSGLSQFREDVNQYFYPPDPTEMSASLGGSVVTNASGARTYRYGPTRTWVRGIRVFLSNGEYLDIPRGVYYASPAGRFVVRNSQGEASTVVIPDYPQPKTKNTAGLYAAPQMDLIDLFIGSEGVLGIITQVEVALLKREEKISVVQFLDSDEQAIQLTEALRAEKSLQLDFLEFYSGNALNLLRDLQKFEPSTVGMPAIPENARSAVFFEMSFDSHAEVLSYSVLDEIVTGCGADMANSWAGYESRELDRFKVFRHLVPETINSIIAERKKQYPGIHKLGTDLAVPDQHLSEMWGLYKTHCEGLGLEWAAFGHIGNNHIHVNILPRNMEELQQGLQLYRLFAQRAVDLGGTISAEHGIGKIKSKFLGLMYTADQIEQMRKVRAALDPKGILNPNVIFPAVMSV
jgi:D-lactate dehydrogenase (cytochrome)